VAATPLQPTLVLDKVGGFAGGDRDQHPPEVVAVVEPGKPAVLGPPAEAVEGAQRRSSSSAAARGAAPSRARASRTKPAKYRSQSRRAASGSPALSPPTQRVTEPSPSVVMAACPLSGLGSVAFTIDRDSIALPAHDPRLRHSPSMGPPTVVLKKSAPR